MRYSGVRLPSPAMVVAFLALTVALGGTGYAASQAGHSASLAAANTSYTVNANTATRAAWPGTLASGKTEAGVWGVDGYASGAGRLVGASAQSFAFPLASAPRANYVTSRPTAACPGSAARPSATRGNLCVYRTGSKNVGTATIYKETDKSKGASRIGFDVVVTSRRSGSVYAYGSWAVRAP
jgi:hypothetical protein